MANRRLLMALAFTALLGSSAYGADKTQNEDLLRPSTGWQFTFAPYMWTAGISGDVGQFGLPPANLNQSIGDILSSLDIGVMAVAEARYDRFVLQTDLSYVQTTEKSNTPLGIFATSVNVRSRSFRGALLGGYELVNTGRVRLDAGAGFQVLSVDTRLSFTGGLLGGTSRTDGDTWVDGLAGLRAKVNFTPKIYMSGWAYAGTGQSDFVWDVMGGVGYVFNDRISSFLGYRANGIDFSDNGFVYDVVQQGPVGGLIFRF